MVYFILVRKHVHIATEPYEAAKGAHAIVVCTEWDEFTVSSIDRHDFFQL